MKKVIIMAFITIGLVLNINAQKSAVSTISSEDLEDQETVDISEIVSCGPSNSKINIRGYVAGGVSGITSSGFGFSDSIDGYDSSPLFSLTVGADIQLPLFKCDNFGFRTGLSFQTQGANFSMGMDEFYDYKLKLTYIKAPAVVEYYVNDKFNLYGGVKVGYLLSAKQDYEDNSIDVKDYYKSIDFSGVLGAEYKIYCNDKISLGTGINYDFGLSDINDNDFGNSDKFKNSSITAFFSTEF